jgi:lipoprotein-releasing system permease protein
MDFEFFIARRYLRSKRKVQFVSVINLISVIGVTVGVAALIVVLSVFNGFTGIVESILVSFDPHLRIEKRGGMDEDEVRLVESLLQNEKEVVGYSAFVSGKAMLVSRGANKVVVVKGIDDETIGSVSGLREKIVLGNLTLRDRDEEKSIVVGLTLADRLGAVVGDEIGFVSPKLFGAAVPSLVPITSERFKIVGIFESDNRDYDASYAYISLETAKELLETGGKYSGVEVRLTDIGLSGRMKASLSSTVPGFQISTWYDLHKDLYSIMKIERWVGSILLSLIIIVSTFNMLGVLTMSVIEKRRDIGVLKSMGATERGVSRIFILEGLLVGLVGVIAGVVLALCMLYVQIRFQVFSLDTTAFIIPAIPVEMHVIDFVAVTVLAFVLSGLASYIPARRASRIVPVEAIRWE